VIMSGRLPPPTAYSNNDDDEDHYGPVNSPPSQSRPPSSQTQRAKSMKEPSSLPYQLVQFPTSPSPTPITSNSAYAPSSMTPLRPERSFHFHRPSIDRRPIGMDDSSSVPLPSDAEKRISLSTRNITRSRFSTREGPHQQ
jgi:hypothetical protein